MKRKVFRFLICTVILCSLVLAGCSKTTDSTESAAAKSDDSADVGFAQTKVAFLLPGSANDGGFNNKGYNAMLHLKELGCETVYSESVETGVQLEALRDYAMLGYDVIVGWGAVYNDDMLTVAEEYPEIQFIIACGTVENDVNVASLEISGAHLGYGYGYLSAMVTESNSIALICGNQGMKTDILEVGGFIEAAKAYNSEVEVTILYVSNPSDVAEAQETAKLCLERGIDVMFGELYAGYQGVLEVAKENDILTFARNAGSIESYPEGCIAYIENSWGLKMEDVLTSYLADGLQHGVIMCGFGTEVRGWEYVYDDDNEFNPGLITDEMAAEFQENVVDMISNGEYTYDYTAEDANPGVY